MSSRPRPAQGAAESRRGSRVRYSLMACLRIVMGFDRGLSPPMPCSSLQSTSHDVVLYCMFVDWLAIAPSPHGRAEGGAPRLQRAAAAARVSWRWPGAGQAPEPVTCLDQDLPSISRLALLVFETFDLRHWRVTMAAAGRPGLRRSHGPETRVFASPIILLASVDDGTAD